MISNIGSRLTLEDTDDLTTSQPNPVLRQRVGNYLLQPGTPNERLYPSWLVRIHRLIATTPFKQAV